MDYGDIGEANGKRLIERIRALPFDPLVACDVGVRGGVSSLLMLEATAGRKDSIVIGIEASEIPRMLKANPRYRVREKIDSVTALSEMEGPVHCAFVDSLHIAHQVAAEVKFLWPLMPVGSLLALHDAVWPAGKCDHYLGREWPTVDVAVEWLFWNRPYASIQFYPESWGMAFIEKTDDMPLEIKGVTWSEVFEARNQLLALLPESIRKREISI